MRRDKRADVASQPRDFLYNARAKKGVGVLGHHKNCFDLLVQFTIHQGELKFKFKVRNSAKAANDSLGGAAGNVVHQEAIEGVRFDGGQVLYGAADHFHAFLQSEEGVFALAFGNGHDDSVEEFCGALEDVQMAVGERVKTARVNCSSHSDTVPIASEKARGKDTEMKR